MHLGAVALRLTGVRTALVPDQALHCERAPRVYHLVEQDGGLVMLPVEPENRFRIDPVPVVRHREVKDILQIGTRCRAFARRPRVDSRASPVCADETKRHSARQVHVHGEIKANSREGRSGKQVLLLEPAPLDRQCRASLRHGRNFVVALVAVADKRHVRDGCDCRAIAVGEVRIVAAERKLAVALPGHEPHVAHKHIAYSLPRFACGCDKFTRLLRHLERRKTAHPLAVRTRDSLRLFAGERDRHLLARRRRAPYRHRPFALKHHAVGERIRQSNGSGKRQRGGHRSQNRHGCQRHRSHPGEPSHHGISALTQMR